MSRIALIGDNSFEYVKKLLRIWGRGDCAVLINASTPSEAALSMMEEANVSECVVERRYSEAFSQAFCPVTVYDAEGKSGLIPDRVRDIFESSYSEEEAIVLFSSGTTGRSKGIILSHRAINTNADAIIDYMRTDASDCLYTVRSLTHSSTVTGELLTSLKSGTKLLITPVAVPPRYVFSKIAEYGVTVICTNPYLLSLYCSEYSKGIYSIPSLKTVYVSGSALDRDLCIKARKIFSEINVYNAYGLSEASPRVTAQRPECCTLNSVGKPVKGVQAAVIGNNGITAETNTRGIIHVKTPSLFSGYTLGTAKHGSLYKDWLNTGDIGYFDENGELFVCGRADDMIVINAHKIYPSDIEEHIRNLSGIENCVVSSVKINGEDALCCLYASERDIRGDIKAKLGQKLLKSEIPKVFVRTDVLPRNANGKLSRTGAKEQLKQYFEDNSDE